MSYRLDARRHEGELNMLQTGQTTYASSGVSPVAAEGGLSR
jgi:hypothetical protein